MISRANLYNRNRPLFKQKIMSRTDHVLTSRNSLTTQAAANFLGFSQPHLAVLLDSDAIPFEKVGQDRTVLMKDLETYRKHRDMERRAALNELAKAEFAKGSYEGVPIPVGGSEN